MLILLAQAASHRPNTSRAQTMFVNVMTHAQYVRATGPQRPAARYRHSRQAKQYVWRVRTHANVVLAW